MRWHASSLFLLRAALAVAPLLALAALAVAQEPSQPVRLPEARREGAMPFEAAPWARHSIRDLKPDGLTLAYAAQLLWAAQGKNRPDGSRTPPSAMAAYPLEVYLVAGSVEGLTPGVYRYRSATHDLVLPRTERLVAMEVGHSAQNIYLQAAALSLGTTFMAGYNDSAMTRVLAADDRPTVAAGIH